MLKVYLKIELLFKILGTKAQIHRLANTVLDTHFVSNWSLHLFPLIPNVCDCRHEVGTMVHGDWAQ